MCKWVDFRWNHELQMYNMRLKVRVSGGKYPWDVIVGDTLLHSADYPDKSIDTLETAKAAAIKWAQEWLAKNVSALDNVK